MSGKSRKDHLVLNWCHSHTLTYIGASLGSLSAKTLNHPRPNIFSRWDLGSSKQEGKILKIIYPLMLLFLNDKCLTKKSIEIVQAVFRSTKGNCELKYNFKIISITSLVQAIKQILQQGLEGQIVQIIIQYQL